MGFVQLLGLFISAKKKGYIINRIREELEKQGEDLKDVYRKWLYALDTEYAFTMLSTQEYMDVEDALLHVVACLGRLDIVKYLVKKKKLMLMQRATQAALLYTLLLHVVT